MSSVSNQFSNLVEGAQAKWKMMAGAPSAPTTPVGLFGFMPLLTHAAKQAAQPQTLLAALNQARSVVGPAVQRLQESLGEEGAVAPTGNLQTAHDAAHYVANQLLQGTPMRKVKSAVKKVQRRASPAVRKALAQGLAIGQTAVQEALRQQQQ